MASRGEVTNTYVRLYYPGSFFAEDDVVKVTKREPKKIAKKYPRTFAFYFFDLVEKEITVGGETKTVASKERNQSPKYYPNGILYDKKKLAELEGKDSILYHNIFGNGYAAGVKCRTGNWQALEKGDVILTV